MQKHDALFVSKKYELIMTVKVDFGTYQVYSKTQLKVLDSFELTTSFNKAFKLMKYKPK